MVASWLVYSGACQTAEEALELWAKRRTDENIRGKVQGVQVTRCRCHHHTPILLPPPLTSISSPPLPQTMSQVRYVHFVDRAVRDGPAAVARARGGCGGSACATCLMSTRRSRRRERSCYHTTTPPSPPPHHLHLHLQAAVVCDLPVWRARAHLARHEGAQPAGLAAGARAQLGAIIDAIRQRTPD